MTSATEIAQKAKTTTVMKNELLRAFISFSGINDKSGLHFKGKPPLMQGQRRGVVLCFVGGKVGRWFPDGADEMELQVWSG